MVANVLGLQRDGQMRLHDGARCQYPAEMTHKAAQNRFHFVLGEHLTDAWMKPKLDFKKAKFRITWTYSCEDQWWMARTLGSAFDCQIVRDWIVRAARQKRINFKKNQCNFYLLCPRDADCGGTNRSVPTHWCPWEWSSRQSSRPPSTLGL